MATFVLLLAACSGSTSIGEPGAGEGQTISSDDDAPTTNTTTAAAEESRLLELATLLPGSALSDSIVFLSDWQLAGEQFGMGPPGDCTNDERLRNYLLELSGSTGLDSPEAYPTQILSGGYDFVEIEAEFGFSICDITGVAEGGQPPNAVSSFTVDTPADLVDERLRSDPLWGPDLMVINEGANQYYQWTDEPLRNEIDRRTAMRPLGRGGAMLVGDGTIVRSPSPDPVEAIAEGDVLGDSKSVTDLVTELAAENAHTVFISQPNRVEPNLLGLSPDDAEAEFETLLDMALEPYPLLGVGVGYDRDERRTFLTVVMLNRNAGLAAENAERFRRIVEESGPISSDASWSEFFTIASSEARGDVTVTRLVATDPDRPLFNFALQTFFRREALFSTS